MANLKIRVAEKDGRTVSNFRLRSNDEVVFINRSDKVLKVEINKNGPESRDALCIDGVPQQEFQVGPKEGTALKICDSYKAETFKYTATIAGTIPEDPIIIIER